MLRHVFVVCTTFGTSSFAILMIVPAPKLAKQLRDGRSWTAPDSSEGLKRLVSVAFVCRGRVWPLN